MFKDTPYVLLRAVTIMLCVGMWLFITPISSSYADEHDHTHGICGRVNVTALKWTYGVP
jgi:hypothetical protein